MFKTFLQLYVWLQRDIEADGNNQSGEGREKKLIQGESERQTDRERERERERKRREEKRRQTAVIRNGVEQTGTGIEAKV